VPQENDTSTLPSVKAGKPPVWTPEQPVAPSAPGTPTSPSTAGSGLSGRLSAARAAVTGQGASARDSDDAAPGSTEDGSKVTEVKGGSGRSTGRSNRSNRQPRKARLTLSHVNVYSVFKFSCVLAIALFFVWLIIVGVLYGVLDVSGSLAQINKAVRTISGDDTTKDVVTGSLVFGGAIIIGAVNIILFIALSTIGSMIYNLCADLVGGVEVTLSERE
jgi:hypothetical protein